MLFHIKEAVRNGIIRLFMASKNDLAQIADKSFSPSDYRQKHIANTTIITVFEKEDDAKFFRECRRHSSLKHYVLSAVDDYFDRVSLFPNAKELKTAVLADLQLSSNYKRLIRIGGVFNRHLTEILCGIYKDYAAVGVPCFGGFQAQEEFIAFIKYISGIIISQKTNAYLPNGMYENFSANKQLSTYKLACMLGVGALITPVQVCSFSDGNVERLGTIMEKAPGYPPSDIVPQERTNVDHSSFLKDLTCLEYLDALCYQLDHRLDNYYVVENEKGQIAHVVAFDNDAARTFFISNKLPSGTYAGCSCVLTKNGAVARPYMDINFAQALRSLNKAMLKEQLGTLMSRAQLHCLWNRIRLLQLAIEKTLAEKKDFLVTDWSTVDLQKAADERYGCTYYKLYLTDTLMLDRAKLFEEMKNQQ